MLDIKQGLTPAEYENVHRVRAFQQSGKVSHGFAGRVNSAQED